MAETGKATYDPAVFYQEIYFATGHRTVEAVAQGALTVWKVNTYNFEHGALLPANIYGAVGAYKAGDIIFITFMAANFQ